MGVSSGKAPPFDMIATIKSIIQNDLMPDLQAMRDAADQDTTEFLDEIQRCNTELFGGSTQVSVNSARSLHAACRDLQKTLYYHNLTHADSYCVKLGHFLHHVKPLRIPHPRARRSSVQYVKHASTTNMCGRSEVTELADNCAEKEAELNNKTHECCKKQTHLEGAFCAWKIELHSNCTALDSCHPTALTAYETHVARAQTLLHKYLCPCNVSFIG